MSIVEAVWEGEDYGLVPEPAQDVPDSKSDLQASETVDFKPEPLVQEVAESLPEAHAQAEA